MTKFRTSADMSNLVQRIQPKPERDTKAKSACGASVMDFGRQWTSLDMSTDIGRVRRQPDVRTDATPPLRGCPPSDVRPDHATSRDRERG
jgi:hypothetical protein